MFYLGAKGTSAYQSILIGHRTLLYEEEVKKWDEHFDMLLLWSLYHVLPKCFVYMSIAPTESKI